MLLELNPGSYYIFPILIMWSYSVSIISIF